MSSTREIVATQAALAAASEGGPAAVPLANGATAGASSMSPEQFAKLIELLTPIAEANALMLPILKAQRAEFDERLAAVAEKPAPESQSGEQSTAAGEQTGA